MKVIIDCEWTYCDTPVRNTKGNTIEREIIQIGCVKISEDLKIIDKLKINVCPVASAKVSQKVTKLTGITYKDLKAHGSRFKAAYNRLLSFIWDIDSTTILSWGEQDKIALDENIKFWNLRELKVEFIDLQAIVGKEFYKGQQRRSVETVLEDWNIPTYGQSHDALNDAINEAKIFMALPNPDELLKTYDPYYYFCGQSTDVISDWLVIEGLENVKNSLKNELIYSDLYEKKKELLIPRFSHNRNYYQIWADSAEDMYLVEECHVSKNRERLICRLRLIERVQYERLLQCYQKYCSKRDAWLQKKAIAYAII